MISVDDTDLASTVTWADFRTSSQREAGKKAAELLLAMIRRRGAAGQSRKDMNLMCGWQRENLSDGLINKKTEVRKMKNYKFWFATGSQDLYGDECLEHVAEHSKKLWSI